MLNSIRKNGLTLAIFACASTGLVAITHALTQSRIQQQEQAQLLSTLNQVIPHALHDNALYAECTLLQSEMLGSADPLPAYIARLNGEPSAIAIEAIAPNGYNGKIKVVVGIDVQGTVLGTRVLSHNETPGLGDKIDLRISDWILSFTGKNLTQENLNTWAVRKDGGEFDQFTGATITPRAVVKAVKHAVEYYQQNATSIFNQPLNCGGSHE